MEPENPEHPEDWKNWEDQEGQEESEERPRSYRELSPDHVQITQAAFLLAHPDCGEDVEIWTGEWSLVCWCGRCEDLRTYQLVDPAEGGPES